MNVDDRSVPEQPIDSNAEEPLQPLPDLTLEGAKPLPSLGTPPESSAPPAEGEPEVTVSLSAETSPPTSSEPVRVELTVAESAPDDSTTIDSLLAEHSAEIARLEAERDRLNSEIAQLQAKHQDLLIEHGKGVYELVMDSLQNLSEHKRQLEADVAKLEKRRDRVMAQMQQTFVGTSEEIAIRLQGFKNYLLGSLQDLAAAAEQMDLPTAKPTRAQSARSPQAQPEAAPNPQFAKQRFQEQRRQIKDILDEYRTAPDYYGPPWQLRRTFEPIHADRVQQWFFKQGGRGTTRSMGSRLQNILVASAIISILRRTYGDRVSILILANTPERLGEWRRGLQDCLGISRSDYGPTRGIALFESPEALAQKADRLVERKQLPLIVMDETEEFISLALLQFPLWLAFVPDPNQMSSYMY